MNIDRLYLEITRYCTFECEHCIKGNREQKNMSNSTLDNIFKDISSVDTLLLTGGEPLINIRILKHLGDIIRDNDIYVKRIGIVTNGTICTDRHIDILRQLKESCDYFEFHLSCDLFHRLEWDRLHTKDLVDRNYKKYESELGLRKFLDNDRYHRVSLFRNGRARFITSSRLEELSKKYYIDYFFQEVDDSCDLVMDDNKIIGKLCIDVNGNVVDFNSTFEEEDSTSESFNVNNDSISSIVSKYINTKNKSYQKVKKIFI